MQTIGKPLSASTAFKWNTLLVVLLVGVGTIFVLHSRGPQYRYLRHGFEILTGKFDMDADTTGDITHFKALVRRCLSGKAPETNLSAFEQVASRCESTDRLVTRNSPRLTIEALHPTFHLKLIQRFIHDR